MDRSGMRTLAVVALLHLSSTAQAQQVEVSAFGVDQGLPQSMVKHVLQDSDGFIWMGTGDGLARFDGHRMVIYKHAPLDSTSIANNSIWGIAERDDTHLYIGTRKGLEILDRRMGVSKRITLGSTGEQNGCWQPIGQKDDRTLFYSPLLCEFLYIEGDRKEHHPTGHKASYAFHVMDLDTMVVMFLQPDSIVIHAPAFDRSRKVHIEVDPIDNYSTLTGFADHYFLLGQNNCYKFDAELRQMPFEGELALLLAEHRGNKRMLRTDDRTCWIGISGVGVVVVNDQLKLIRRYPLDPSVTITSLTKDRQGNIWVGTDGHGVYRIAPQRIKFERFMPGQGAAWEPASWFVKGFAQWDDEHVLVSFHNGGCAIFNEPTNSLTPADIPGSKAAEEDPIITTDASGLIWFHTPKWIEVFDPRQNKVLFSYPKACGDRAVFSQYAGPTIWRECGPPLEFRRANGALEIQEPTPYYTIMREGGTTPGFIHTDGLNRTWTWTVDRPLEVWDPGGILTRPLPQGTSNPTNARPTSILEIDESIWMTSDQGLFHFNAKDLSLIRHFTIHDGLPDQYLYGMLRSPDGHFWISSNNGLFRFDPTTANSIIYRKAQGIQSNEFNSNAYFRSRSGRFYFGGINGFNHFDPEAIKSDPDTPSVQLIAVQVQGVQVDQTGWVELPYGRNDLILTIAVMEMTDPAGCRLAYRIPGQIEWRIWDPSRDLEIHNLGPGDHSILVKGISADGVESVETEILRVHVPLPFHASTLAAVLAGCAGAAIIGGVLFLIHIGRERKKARLAELQMKELRIRARIAQDLHDDVGSGLARITALAHTAERRTQKGEDAKDQVGKVRLLSQELMHDLRDVVWINDPKEGTLAELLLRIREYLLDTFEHTQVSVVTDLPSPLPEDALNGPIRRELYLIMKEAIHNVYKHSNASRIVLRASQKGSTLIFKVEDDGQGMDMERLRSGHGTRNMQERASSINCDFEIKSDSLGTCISITCDLQDTR